MIKMLKYSRSLLSPVLGLQQRGISASASRLRKEDKPIRIGPKTRLRDFEDEDDDERKLNPMRDIEQKIEASKAKLQWRTPHGENQSEWQSKFSLFAPERNRSRMAERFNRADLESWASFRESWRVKKDDLDRQTQTFITERHETLGNDLAAAHFIVSRFGQVR